MRKKENDITKQINNLEKILDECLKKHDYSKAIGLYTKIINYKSDEAVLYLKRAELYCRLAQSYENVAGEIWRNEERYNNAIKDCTKAIILDSERKEYYMMRANIYTNVFEEDRMALKDYLNAYKIDKNDDNICLKIGDMYSLIDDLENAIKYYELALSINFRNELALYSIASIYDLNDKIEKAVKYYTEFTKYSCNNNEVYCDRANCFYKLKIYDKALEDLKTFVKNNGSNTKRSFNLRARVFEALGRTEEALIEYRKATNIEKDENIQNKIKELENNTLINCKNMLNNRDIKVVNNTIKFDMTIKRITEFEEIIGTILPNDYRKFLINNDERKLKHSNFKTRDGFIESSIADMLSITGKNSRNLYEEYETLNKGNKIPKTLIAIAIDPAETPICLCIKGKNKGKVYYWLREFEMDNCNPSYKNMHVIADTFQEFLNNLN